MKKQIVIATHNTNKLKEFKSLFEGTPYEVLGLADIKFNGEIKEDGETFADNAVIKAQTIHKFTNLPVIADDSGLCLNALDGFPGVNSARFMEGLPYSEKNAAIIKMLEGYSDKSAKFVCAIALVGLEKFPQVFIGEVKGMIINEERGKEGFGYDPIFFHPNSQKTFGEMSIKEKDDISHRGRATSLLFEYLKTHYF
ncbi:MAG: Non-canonical purine NTP pyrophosphatase [Tenericutes bacterium ADurb.Bin087]|nr:MAG: Non-canonical purine NTP pyrophosphatase [Tenericutes bacterium ADurb.Bin087]